MWAGPAKPANLPPRPPQCCYRLRRAPGIALGPRCARRAYGRGRCRRCRPGVRACRAGEPGSRRPSRARRRRPSRPGASTGNRGRFSSCRLLSCVPLPLALNDVVDADLGVILLMALVLDVMLAPAKLEDLHLVAAAVAEHGGLDERAGNERRADFYPVPGADEKHLVEGNVGADIGAESFEAEFGAGLDAVLFAAGFDHCVHGIP